MTESTFGGGFRPGLVEIVDPPFTSLDFLASEVYTVKRGGVTLDATTVTADGDGNKIVKGGTPLFKHPATGKYGPAIEAGALGDDAKMKGLLFAGDINLRHGDQVVGMMLTGSVIAARLPAASLAQAKTDLGAHITFQ